MIELQTELMFNFVFLCAVHTPSFIQSFRFTSNNAVTNFENKGFMKTRVHVSISSSSSTIPPPLASGGSCPGICPAFSIASNCCTSSSERAPAIASYTQEEEGRKVMNRKERFLVW